MGHDAVDVRDMGMRSAPDEAIAAQARQNRQILITRDFDFADIRNYPPADYAGIVVLQLSEDATAGGDAVGGVRSP
jgi:predicted nuclease of predicted toxin-antitoxin system